MIKAILVDDEPLALEIMETYINQIPEIQLVKKCENAFEANEVLKSQHIDLMFLDIQMPQLSGINFLEHFPIHQVSSSLRHIQIMLSKVLISMQSIIY